MLLTMALLFLVLAIGVFALASGFDQRNEQARIIRDRLTSVERASRRRSSPELALLRDELLSEIPALHKLLARSARVTHLQTFLAQAEVNMRAGKFLLLSACSGCVAALLLNLFTRSPLIALVGLAAFAFLPMAFVAWRRSRRFRAFERMFPEAIDLLARAVRAGHAFNTALEVIANEIGQPVSGEFRKLFEELKFGLPLRDAMLNLSERMPITDVRFFVTAVLLQRETGGNLAELLDKLSYLIRERFKILRQVRVYTAQGRLTLGILMVLPPGVAFAISLIHPEFIRPLFTDPVGQMMITVAAVMQFIGFLLIRKIIHIQV